MAQKKNYLMEAVKAFTKDFNIKADDEFTLTDEEGKEHKARFTPMGTFLVDGECRNDLLSKLLAGVYDVETARGKYVMEPGKPSRGFELIQGYEGEPRLPERATKHSAGYDFFAARDLVVLPHKVAIAFTGIKAFMQPDEVLKIYNRSSNPVKKGLMLANGVGLVDADYYNNPDNEGDIGFSFLNITDEIVYIHKGEKLGQGVFERYDIADGDTAEGERAGGFGSTGT